MFPGLPEWAQALFSGAHPDRAPVFEEEIARLDQNARQQRLAEMIGGMIEDAIDTALERAGDHTRFPNAQDPLMIEPTHVPDVVEAQVPLPALPESRAMMERLATEVIVPEVRGRWASAIRNDMDEFVYVPANSALTERDKAKRGEPARKPLLGTGELVQQMEFGWLPQAAWVDGGSVTYQTSTHQTLSTTSNATQLNVAFGPTQATDQEPSDKYKNMFLGAHGVGPGHKVRIPPRFLYITASMRRGIMSQTSRFLESAPEMQQIVGQMLTALESVNPSRAEMTITEVATAAPTTLNPPGEITDLVAQNLAESLSSVFGEDLDLSGAHAGRLRLPGASGLDGQG